MLSSRYTCDSVGWILPTHTKTESAPDLDTPVQGRSLRLVSDHSGDHLWRPFCGLRDPTARLRLYVASPEDAVHRGGSLVHHRLELVSVHGLGDRGARSPAVARGRSRPERRGSRRSKRGVLAGRAGLRDGRIGATLRYVRGLSPSRPTSTRAITPRQGGSLEFGRRLGGGCPFDTARSGFARSDGMPKRPPHLEEVQAAAQFG